MSTIQVERVQKLLDKSIPSYRQAYSDRTAWLMSCMSSLAYKRFNPLIGNGKEDRDRITKGISDLVDDARLSSFKKLIVEYGYDESAELEELREELRKLGCDLNSTFSHRGTQAFLASNDRFAVLAFRGTEATSIADIKTDLKASTTNCPSGGKLHSGFDEAFSWVQDEIQSKLKSDEFSNKPLLITGHSLGGALATVAAKKINHGGGIAACYTFGSPRVGDEIWVSDIKTPIYRLVNSADCVTMLPPSSDTIALLSWFFKFISRCHVPGLSTASGWVGRNLNSKLGGYMHAGDMRYLTNCPAGNYEDVKLLYSVSFTRRIKAFLTKKLPYKKFVADHAIDVYASKLMIVAEQRNKAK